MNKTWTVFLFLGWTVAMLVLAPIFFSFSTYSVSTLRTPGALGLPGAEIKQITKRPILDWTGRLATTYTEIIWEDTVIFSSVPGKSGITWRSDMLANYYVKMTPDGTPEFRRRNE